MKSSDVGSRTMATGYKRLYFLCETAIYVLHTLRCAIRAEEHPLCVSKNVVVGEKTTIDDLPSNES